MHWELWAVNTGNLISTHGAEDEALHLVRELVASGWDPADLSLGIEDESLPVDAIPAPLEGVALAARAGIEPPLRRAK